MSHTRSHSRDSAGNTVTDVHLHLRGYWKVACLHNIQDLKRNSDTHGSLPKQFKINKTIYNMDIWYLHQVVLQLQGCLEGLHCGLVFDVRWQVVPL